MSCKKDWPLRKTIIVRANCTGVMKFSAINFLLHDNKNDTITSARWINPYLECLFRISGLRVSKHIINAKPPLPQVHSNMSGQRIFTALRSTDQSKKNKKSNLSAQESYHSLLKEKFKTGKNTQVSLSSRPLTATANRLVAPHIVTWQEKQQEGDCIFKNLETTSMYKQGKFSRVCFSSTWVYFPSNESNTNFESQFKNQVNVKVMGFFCI